MGKVRKLADGGSFSRRTSSFINAPKFRPTLPDVPDIKGIDLLAKQPRASTARGGSTNKGKLVDFKLPEIKGRPGRVEWIQNEFMNNVHAYQRYGMARGSEWFYTPEAQMMGTNIINEMLQWKVKAEQEHLLSKTAYDKSIDSHNDPWLSPYNLDYRARKFEERDTGELNEDGTPIMKKYLSEKIDDVPILDYHRNRDLYGKPLTIAEDYANDHYNVTRNPFGDNNQNIPITATHASMKDADAFMRKTMIDAASKGIGNVKYKVLNEIDVSSTAIAEYEGSLFELIRETVKDNFSNLEAAKEVLRLMPEKYKAAYIRDWAVKLNNGSYTGEQAEFYESILGSMSRSLRDRDERVTDSKPDGSNLGGGAPGYWYQVLNGTAIVSDQFDKEETYWVDDPTALDGKKAKQDMRIWNLPTHPKMKPFNNLNDLESGIAMATSQFTDKAWVMGTKVDFSELKKGVYKDPNIITGVEYMIDPEGNETLFKNKILFVDGDQLDNEDLRILVPTHTVNSDGTPKNEAVLQGVFGNWWAANNLEANFADKGTFGRIEGDQAEKINKTVGLGDEREVYYINIKVRMTLQEIMILELDGLKSRQAIEARFFRDALLKQKEAKKPRNSLIEAIDPPDVPVTKEEGDL